MLHNPAVPAESDAVKELGCCSVWGAKLERKLAWAFGVVLEECIKERRSGSWMCSCCDWVEKIGWVKEWRRKRNIRKGKRAARSGSDGNGGRSAQALFVGNREGDGDGGDGNEQRGSGSGNGGGEEKDETGNEGASAAGQSDSRESVANRQIGEQSNEVH